MQVAVETIEDLRAKDADRAFRRARLGLAAMELPLLPPPTPRRIEIIDCEPADTAMPVTECWNDVAFMLDDGSVARGAHVFVGPHDLRLKTANIQRVVAEHFNVAVADILSARRTANVVRPRQIAMYLTKVLTLRSLPEIGRRFGGRDHTTVLHAVRKIEALVSKDVALSDEVELLKRQLQE